MPLLGCFVVPHPPIIVPEVGREELAKVESTVKAMETLSEEMGKLDPETIVLLSPHAALARSQMGVSAATAYHGSFAHFRAPRVTIQAKGDLDIGRAILDGASQHGIPTFIVGSHESAYELDHGTMVPLYYLAAKLSRVPKLVVLSFSYLSLEDHAHFGRVVGKVLQESPTRSVYVASSDLSHRLIPGASAGYDPRGAEFDRAVVDLFGAGDWDKLLSLDSWLVEAAGECGYRSLAVLSGVVDYLESSGMSTKNRVLSYEGPFGVGYMVGRVDIQPAEAAKEVSP